MNSVDIETESNATSLKTNSFRHKTSKEPTKPDSNRPLATTATFNFENQLLHLKSNLKRVPKNVYKGDDFNSVTSSDLSSRSDLETINSIKDSGLNTSKMTENENKSSTIQSIELNETNHSSMNAFAAAANANAASNLSIESNHSQNEDDIDVYKYIWINQNISFSFSLRGCQFINRIKDMKFI